MKKLLPLLLLLTCLKLNGQKRNNSSPKSYSFDNLMNADEKISYIPNTDKRMTSAEILPEYCKRINLYPTLSFNATLLNKTGRLNILLPTLLKLLVIFSNYVLTGFLTIIPVSLAVKHSLLSLSYQYQKPAEMTTIDSV